MNRMFSDQGCEQEYSKLLAERSVIPVWLIDTAWRKWDLAAV